MSVSNGNKHFRITQYCTMSIRPVQINVTEEFRHKIKGLKRELTYEEYFNYLLENSKGKESPQSIVSKTTTSKETK